MRIRNANGTILETENALVVAQWIKAGFVDISEPAEEEKKPEEEKKSKRTRRAKQ